MNGRFIGTALALSVAAGCSASPSPEAAQWVEPAPAATAAPDSGEQNTVNTPVIKMGRLALGPLPPAVANQLSTAISVDTAASYASGVAVQGGFLTAGHVFRKDGNQRREDCANPGVTFSGSGGTRTVKHASATEIASILEERTDTFGAPSQDMAFMRTHLPYKTHTAKLDAANKDMRPGEKVYAVAYGPTASGTYRAPDEDAPYNTPAVFSGFVVDDPKGTSEPTVFAFGYGQSYGEVRDTLTRHGFSGGAIFNGDGVVKALISGITAVNPTIRQVETDYNVSFTGVTSEEDTIQLVSGQPMNQAMMARLRRQIEPVQTGAC